jgi:phosphate transport system substrate-binding protein
LKRARHDLWASAGAGLLLVCASLTGCAGKPARRQPPPAAPIVVVSEPEVAAVVRACAADYTRLYPGPEVRVEVGHAREAMAALFGARAQAAVIGRELADEERVAARRAGLVIEANRWVQDGLAIVVHPSNPIQQLALDDVRGIFAGTTISWGSLGGPDRRIVPVVQDPETGVSQFFADLVMAGGGFAAPAQTVANDSLAALRVASEPAAIAYVSLPFADRGVKALRVARVRGLPYVPLDARTVRDGRYPLPRYYNVVLRVPGNERANEFNTYLCALEGQRRALAAGWVPATVPVRFTERTPTLPSH